jgi:hypothetical protein
MNARLIARTQQRLVAGRRAAKRRAAERRSAEEGGASPHPRAWALVVYEAGAGGGGEGHRVGGLYPAQEPAEAAAQAETLRGLDELRYGEREGYAAAFAAPCGGGEAGGPDWWPSLEGGPGGWRVALHGSAAARAAAPAAGRGAPLPRYSEPGRAPPPALEEGAPI